jgi:subtilisin family serine protease
LTLEILEDRLAPATTDYRSVIGLNSVLSQYPAYNGAGYSVAILDTGIDYNDTDLGGGSGAGHRVVAGYDFVNNVNDIPMDDNGHGTLLAGIIGSSNPNAPGIVPNVNFIDLKVLDSQMNGSWSSIDSALQWVIAHKTQYNIVAVNLSLGSGNYTGNPYSLLESDFSSLKGMGVFTAVAAGNNFYSYNSTPGVAFPAISSNVVSVGATWAGNFGSTTWTSGAQDYATATDQIVSSSQRGPGLDILAPGAWLTSDGLNNATLTEGGTSMATAVISGAAVLLHEAYDKTGQSALATQDNILALMKSTGVSIVDNDAKDANVVPTYMTFQRLNLAAAVNAVGQPVLPPTISPIAAQTLQVGQTITVPLSVTSPSGKPITYTWSQVYSPALAYQLKQQYGLSYAGGYYLNYQGQNEKWLLGTGNVWYWILPDGEVRRWAGSNTATLSAANLLGTLDASYYSDPSKLWNASYAGMPPAVLGLSGTTLSIRAPAYWVGTYSVAVSASDGTYTVKQTFNVNEVPPPPVLTAPANQTMTHSQHALTLTLTATDSDNGPLTYSALVLPLNGQTPAVAVSVQGNQLTVHPGLSFVGTFTVQVSAIDGTLSATKTFTVTVTDTAPVLGAIANQTASHGVDTVLTLSASDADGDALSYAAQVLPSNGQTPALTATVQGSQLTLHPTQPIAGTFTIQVTVSDGAETATRTFTLTLTNTAPTLAAIAAQTMAAGQTSLTVPLTAADADHDTLKYQALAETPDATAYQLNQQYGFHEYNGSYYPNLWGQNEKWLVDKSNVWYMLLPNGKIYRWAQTVAATLQPANLIATLSTAIYAEPRLLRNAQPPVTPALTFSFTGGQLTLQRPAGLTGVFFVDVNVNDGFTTTKQTFEVVLN